MNDAGIAIIDVYGQSDLDECYKSLSKMENLIIVSNTKNKLPECKSKRFSHFVPFATLRNYAINHFRSKGLKHLFLINSNQIIKNADVFKNTIKTANVFGIWFLLGPETSNLTIEDDEHNINLNISDKINSDFIYLYNGIVSNVGFFDERYFNTKSLDVLDYILRLRDKKIYPPTGFVPVMLEGIDKTNGSIQNAGYREMKNADQSVNMSYAYFLTKYQYIPTQNDPKPATNDELMKSLEELQTNHSSKL